MTPQEAEKVFDLMHRHWPEGSVGIRVFAKLKDKSWGMVCGNPRQLRNAVDWAERAGWNVYLHMNPSNKLAGMRLRTEEVTHWCWFLVDIDPVGEGADPLTALNKVHSILSSYLGEKDLQRYVIDSGRGMQAWYPIVPVALTDLVELRSAAMPRDFTLEDRVVDLVPMSMRDAAPRCMGYWLNFLRERLDLVGNEGCVVDLCARDLPRVMRMPFTVNIKTGQRGSILEEASHTNVSLAHKLLNYAPYSVWKQTEITPVAGADASTPWQVFIPHMTRAGRMFVLEGSDEGGRHHAAVAAARSLRDLGCSAAQARLALIAGGKVCTPVFDASEVETIIRRNFNGIAAAQ